MRVNSRNKEKATKQKAMRSEICIFFIFVNIADELCAPLQTASARTCSCFKFSGKSEDLCIKMVFSNQVGI